MHVYNALEIISSIPTPEVDLLIRVDLVPCLVNGEEESEPRSGIEKMSGFWCEDAMKIGQ